MTTPLSPAPCSSGPSYNGSFLSSIPNAIRPLRDSSQLREDGERLRARMKQDGYLYLPGLLNSEEVMKARMSILEALDAEGMLDESSPREEAVAKAGIDLAFRPELATGNAAVEHLLYDGAMMDFWACFFDRGVRHFDFTWLRAKAPAESTVTPPHCDSVFMNRGTDQLYTAWTPLGAVPFDQGGLMILENSHRNETELGAYWSLDVDRYCSNGPEAAAIESGELLWEARYQNGSFDPDALSARSRVGGSWLCSEYQPGDVLVFGMKTLHAAADNRSGIIRLSTDSRYQPEGEAMDERWIGRTPIAHGPHAKKGMIC